MDYEVFLDSIQSMPGFTICFLARFQSVEAVLRTLQRLSFVSDEDSGLILPPTIKALVQELDTGEASVVLGGALTSEQRLEAFEALNKSAVEIIITLADGIVSPDLDDFPVKAQSYRNSAKKMGKAGKESRRKWWEFWKNDQPRERPKEVLASEEAFKESEAKSFNGKTRKCINCNAKFPQDGLYCSACGSSRFIWE